MESPEAGAWKAWQAPKRRGGRGAWKERKELRALILSLVQYVMLLCSSLNVLLAYLMRLMYLLARNPWATLIPSVMQRVLNELASYLITKLNPAGNGMTVRIPVTDIVNTAREHNCEIYLHS